MLMLNFLSRITETEMYFQFFFFRRYRVKPDHQPENLALEKLHQP